MRRGLDHFLSTEDGAVSAEFLVVTSAAVALCLATFATLSDGYLDTTVNVNQGMEATVLPSYSARSD